jgi:Zn finger protein HypA/HybF involved in hydrogenase expression
MYIGGLLPAIHNPQVWIDRTDIERARPILTAYEQKKEQGLAVESGAIGIGQQPVEVVCEECDRTAQFPAVQGGTVQNCPHCGAFIDVGDDAEFEGWEEADGDGNVEPK